MIYHVIKTDCTCHPETCCCWKYKVVNFMGHMVAGYDYQHDALEHCKELNKGNN